VGTGGTDGQRFHVVEMRRDADSGNEPVHDRVKRECVVGAGRESKIHNLSVHRFRGSGVQWLVLSQSITAFCAAFAASLMSHDLVSRFVTMLLLPRTSPTWIPCRCSTCATAAPSMFSIAPFVRSSRARAEASVP